MFIGCGRGLLRYLATPSIFEPSELLIVTVILAGRHTIDSPDLEMGL